MLESILSSAFAAAYLPYINAILVVSAVFAIGLPLNDYLKSRERIKFVALDRTGRIRKRRKSQTTLLANADASELRISTSGAFVNAVIEKLDLKRWLNSEEDAEKLNRAGLRGAKAESTFLIARLLTTIGAIFIAIILISGVMDNETSDMKKGILFFITVFLGYKLPDLYVSDLAKKRNTSMLRAFPDALDLLLICVESGMSIENAFKKVSQEIGNTSIPLAEELLLTTAELSFLSERRVAYENLAKRTNMDDARSLSTVLIQADRYGTSLGSALRVISKECRDARMLIAEKKAASLSTKLTIPMVLFFMPALFIIVLGPSVIQLQNSNGF